MNASSVKSMVDQCAEILTHRLRAQRPFIFVRYGDGALECVAGKSGATCDGERYTKELADDLLRCWKLLFTRPENVLIGHWLTASFDNHSKSNRYANQYEALITEAANGSDVLPLFVHFESLLLMRDSPSLVQFYKSVRADKRKKLLMGPAEWQRGAEALNADFYAIPVTSVLHALKGDIRVGLNIRDFDVLLYGAGMAGNVPVIEHWNDHPEKTYINLGSALDPVYRGRTRQQQLSYNEALKFMAKVCE